MDIPLEELKNYTDLDAIQEIFLKLRQQEETVTKDLDQLLQNQAHLETKMKNLHQVVPQLNTIQGGCENLHKTIHNTNVLAEAVSRKVRQLDMAKGHVDGCITRVNDIIDLTKCVDGVQDTMASDNYEQAAAHIHRYLSLDKDLLSGIDDDVNGSFALLHDAELRLINSIDCKFESAIKEDNQTAIERFIKLYPLVGRADEGLTRYSKYLARKVAVSSEQQITTALKTSKDDKRSSVIFADTLTMLFESTARLIEDSYPLVETFYGPGNLMRLITPIQEECERKARSIVNNFLQARSIVEHVTSLSTRANRAESVQETDPRTLDPVLEEMCLMNSRAELYSRFLQRKVSQHNAKSWKGGLSTLQEEIMGHYICLEDHFMRQSIRKAISLESTDKSSLVSSLVDDVCFVIQKCVKRSIGSGSVDTTCAMINNAGSSLSVDVCSQLMVPIKAGYPAPSLYSWQQGSDSQALTQKQEFLTASNNAHIFAENVLKLKRDFEIKCQKSFTTNETGQAKISSCINNFSDAASDLKDVLKKAESGLCNSAILPRLHPVIAEFASTSHVLTEDNFYSLEVEDPWLQEVVKVLDELIKPLKSVLAGPIYDCIVVTVTTEMTEYLEKLALTCSFNQLGGLQFDKRLRSLVTYLSAITQWTVRDKFGRLTQIALILSSERLSEVAEYWSGGPLSCRLSPAEVRQCLSMRTDFRQEDVNKLVLQNS